MLNLYALLWLLHPELLSDAGAPRRRARDKPVRPGGRGVRRGAVPAARARRAERRPSAPGAPHRDEDPPA